MKKTTKVIVGILIILIIGLFLYWFFWYADTDPGEGGVGQPDPIFPFSGGQPGDDSFFEDDDETDVDNDPSSTYTPQPNLWQISDRPVAGSQWVTDENGRQEVWYVHRENGHLFRHSTKNRESTRLTNTTIPRVQEAVISPQGDYIIYRYIDAGTDNTKTYMANITPTENGDMPYQVQGEFWSDNIKSVNASPLGERVFYLRSTSDGTIGVVVTMATEEVLVVFESDLTEWRSQWSTNDSITVFNSPAQNTRGFSHTINTKTGEMNKLVDGRGMTATLSPDNQYVITSKLDNNQYRSYLHTASDTQSNLMTIPTFSEKCGWRPGGNIFFCGVPTGDFPNPNLRSWYQGVNNFTDELHVFVPESREQENLFGDEEMDMGPFDITDIKVDPNFNFLSFENKRDYILWGLQL
jgi:hypothetical protein